jgi:glycosyltransferase involved in cell wall biosynthesis
MVRMQRHEQAIEKSDSPDPPTLGRGRRPLGKPEGLSVIIPAYNEEDGINKVLSDLKLSLDGLDMPREYIVVDDGSSDGTSEVLRTIEYIKVIRHARNEGYGAAIKRGMEEARYDWVCITDADGTYPNEKIPELLSAMGENDMVVGARVLKGVNIPLVRRPAKWILNRLADYLAQQKIPDLNSGLRVFRKQVAECYLNILPDRFSFTTTITLAMLCNNFKVHFIPIDYHHRTGKSKIRPFQDTMNFLQMIVRTILYFNPLRIFLPMGVGLLLTSTTLFVLRLIKGGGFAVTIPMFLLAGIQILAIGMLADLIDRRIKP